MKQEIRTFQDIFPRLCNRAAMQYAKESSKKIVSANLTMDNKGTWYYLTVVFEELSDK